MFFDFVAVETHDIGMPELGEIFESLNLVGEVFGFVKMFDSDNLFVFVVIAFIDFPVAALPESPV